MRAPLSLGMEPRATRSLGTAFVVGRAFGGLLDVVGKLRRCEVGTSSQGELATAALGGCVPTSESVKERRLNSATDDAPSTFHQSKAPRSTV
jgi:hypothetical protein